MGRKTFESIGNALPGRLNIIMTRDPLFRAQGCRIVSSRDQAITAAGNAEEMMVIGGEEIYKEFLPIADRIYLTIIDASIEGDTFFPEIDMTRWHEVNHQAYRPDEKNPYSYAFVTLEKT